MANPRKSSDLICLAPFPLSEKLQLQEQIKNVKNRTVRSLDSLTPSLPLFFTIPVYANPRKKQSILRFDNFAICLENFTNLLRLPKIFPARKTWVGVRVRKRRSILHSDDNFQGKFQNFSLSKKEEKSFNILFLQIFQIFSVFCKNIAKNIGQTRIMRFLQHRIWAGRIRFRKEAQSSNYEKNQWKQSID